MRSLCLSPSTTNQYAPTPPQLHTHATSSRLGSPHCIGYKPVRRSAPDPSKPNPGCAFASQPTRTTHACKARVINQCTLRLPSGSSTPARSSCAHRNSTVNGRASSLPAASSKTDGYCCPRDLIWASAYHDFPYRYSDFPYDLAPRGRRRTRRGIHSRAVVCRVGAFVCMPTRNVHSVYQCATRRVDVCMPCLPHAIRHVAPCIATCHVVCCMRRAILRRKAADRIHRADLRRTELVARAWRLHVQSERPPAATQAAGAVRCSSVALLVAHTPRRNIS